MTKATGCVGSGDGLMAIRFSLEQPPHGLMSKRALWVKDPVLRFLCEGAHGSLLVPTP